MLNFQIFIALKICVLHFNLTKTRTTHKNNINDKEIVYLM